MIDNQKLFKKKKALAEKLLERNVILIYDEVSPSLFVATDTMSANEVGKIVTEEGFKLSQPPLAGVFISDSMKKNGYWCFLR